jgi:hypothetical protein
MEYKNKKYHVSAKKNIIEKSYNEDNVSGWSGMSKYELMSSELTKIQLV